MDEKIEAIFKQVLDEACENPLYRFAELVRQDEREACAKLCEHSGRAGLSAIQCAAAIRGRTG